MTDTCKTCPYCRGIPGVGVSPPAKPRTPFDQVLYKAPEIVLTPALGMLVPGMFLIISRSHRYSFASFGEKSLTDIDSHIQRIINWLQPIFGEYLIFEHGASSTQTESHGGCIMHAHLHLFPTARETAAKVLEALSWEMLESISQLSDVGDIPYALLGLNKQYFLSKSVSLPSQWIRKVVAESLGTSKHWDWGAYFGSDELKETIAMLGGSSIERKE